MDLKLSDFLVDPRCILDLLLELLNSEILDPDPLPPPFIQIKVSVLCVEFLNHM